MFTRKLTTDNMLHSIETYPDWPVYTVMPLTIHLHGLHDLHVQYGQT